MVKQQFSWTTFYMEFADRLLNYKDDRQSLLKIIEDSFNQINMKNPFINKGSLIKDICPFMVMGAFNKGMTDSNRLKIAEKLGNMIGVKSETPSDLEGIPRVNNMHAWFFRFEEDQNEDDIDKLWALFEAAIQFADNHFQYNRENFIEHYNSVKELPEVKWMLTMGLFWIRPYTYLNLDGLNRKYILNQKEFSFVKEITNLTQVPTGEEYLNLLSAFSEHFQEQNTSVKSFLELSYCAWLSDQGSEVSSETGNTRERKYWIYSPGKNASMWDEFYEKGIMGIVWGKLGDLRKYSSKEEMKQTMKKLYNEDLTYLHAGHATWQFANEMFPGDVVFAKKGRSIVLGYGIVESEYIYDETRNDFNHIRKVRWLENGEWPHPGQAVNKALTDITPYTEYIQKLNLLFEDDIGEIEEGLESDYETYTKQNFLNDVFMGETSYDKLVRILNMKKNLILQGPPGVGKTFLAKRLAYSIMNKKDTSRVKMIQFHQSYSYEDFMMGYHPSGEGFELTEGPFYKFCKQAETDSERDYFFIIDEINRGNLSQIFGELMMLLENDKRGEELQLIYKNEQFSIPENVYVIGMMNTADRSLAMIDYALRRRFAFYQIEPAFDSEGFQEIIDIADNPKFNKLVDVIKELNQEIKGDEALGSGFVIGHSYLTVKEKISDEKLSVIIEFELLPLLEEYWFDDEEKYLKWKDKLTGVLNDTH